MWRFSQIKKIKNQIKVKKNDIPLNSFVRIAKRKGTFDKYYTPNFSDEIFKVIRIIDRNPRIYILSDCNNEKIAGIFYREELVITKNDQNTLYRVNEILKKRKLKGKKEEYFVSWVGYNNSHNCWINAEDLVGSNE